MPYMDLERLTFYIDYETLKVQKNEIFLALILKFLIFLC